MRHEKLWHLMAWYGAGYYDYPEPDPPAPPPAPTNAPDEGSEGGDKDKPDKAGSTTGPRERGLVLGRFMPPHRGHQYLVDFAAGLCDSLTVLLCHGPDDAIPGELRLSWAREVFPRATVIGVDDPPPTGSPEEPAFFAAWADIVRAHLPGGADLLFSSDPRAFRLAELLSARSVLVDPERTAVPISATKLRADPAAHWDYLPPCVRPYFTRRVCLLGPESTGKSTLSRALSARYGTVHVPEYMRSFASRRSPRAEDLRHVAKAQRAAEDALARQARGVLFCDTDLLSLRLWSERLFGAAPGWLAEEAARAQPDLYLLSAPDVPFVGPARRDDPAARQAFAGRCLDAVAKSGVPFTVLSGPWQARQDQAVAAVDALLSRSGSARSPV